MSSDLHQFEKFCSIKLQRLQGKPGNEEYQTALVIYGSALVAIEDFKKSLANHAVKNGNGQE